MNMQVTLNISETFAAAINGLADAIRSINAPQAAASETGSPAAKKVSASAKSAAKTESGPIYWADNSTGFFGKVETEAQYQAKKDEDEGVYKITEAIYNQKLDELNAKNAAKKTQAAETKKTQAAEKASKPAKAESAAEHPALEDLVEVFSRYLPKDLTKEERAERASFVKPLLQRFGAAKATELLPEHRALAMNLVERKLAGEDINPASADFAEIAAEAEEDLV